MIKDSIFKALSQIEKRAKELEINEKVDELKALLAEKGVYPVKEEEKKTNPVVIVLAVIGAIAAVAGIAYAVYTFLIPEDSEDFEDFDDDDLEDDDLEGDE